MSCVSWCQQSLQVFVLKPIALRRSVERDGGDAFCDVKDGSAGGTG